MTEFALASFAALFVTINPIEGAALFPVLTDGMTRKSQQRIAVKATIVAGGLLVAFAMVGDDLLRVLGISLPAVQVGGGVLLMLVSIDIVFGRGFGAPVEANGNTKTDISVFPLATPVIAGPGAITAVVVKSSEANNDILTTAVLVAVLAVVMGMALGALLAASTIQRWLGTTGMSVVIRIVGLLLTALSSELILRGLKDSGIFH